MKIKFLFIVISKRKRGFVSNKTEPLKIQTSNLIHILEVKTHLRLRKLINLTKES